MDGTHFDKDTVAAWLNFYALALTEPEAGRLLSIYHRRLRSNLIHALRPRAGDQAPRLAETLGALIDGVYLRAVLDLPLGDPSARSPWTVMANVLVGEHPDLYATYRHLLARDPGLRMHLYGKGVRPGRKLGHVTAYGTDLPGLRERTRHAADYLQGVITS